MPALSDPIERRQLDFVLQRVRVGTAGAAVMGSLLALACYRQAGPAAVFGWYGTAAAAFALRLWLVSTHYRSPVNYTQRALEEASERAYYIYQAVRNADRGTMQITTPRLCMTLNGSFPEIIHYLTFIFVIMIEKTEGKNLFANTAKRSLNFATTISSFSAFIAAIIWRAHSWAVKPFAVAASIEPSLLPVAVSALTETLV